MKRKRKSLIDDGSIKKRKNKSHTERPSDNLSTRRPASRDYFVNLLPLLLSRSAFFLVTKSFGKPKVADGSGVDPPEALGFPATCGRVIFLGELPNAGSS